MGVSKRGQANSQDHSGRKSILDDVSMTDLKVPEQKLVASKKIEKLPKIPKIAARDLGLIRGSANL